MRGGGWREGALVRLQDGSWGDAAPLPGWSAESLEDVAAWLRSPQGDPPASVRAALEMGNPGAALRDKVPVNALLTGGLDAMKDRGREAVEAGCRCLKIKAAELSAPELADLLRALCASGGEIRFRIDPNRAWTPARTRETAAALGGFRVEYFEEPVAGFEALRGLAEAGVPIALDETLRETEPAALGAFSSIAALVLKPTLMGGFEICRRFALEGARFGIPSVVSACYESGVGIAALGRFAASLPLISDAGLDTYAALEEDVLTRRLAFPGFEFAASEPVPEVDLGKLVF